MKISEKKTKGETTHKDDKRLSHPECLRPKKENKFVLLHDGQRQSQ